MKTLFAWFVVLALTCGFASAQTYKVIWSFGGAASDGAYPMSNLIFDKAGNLYGTTQFGGSATALVCVSDGGCGTVFQLSPNRDGTWTETILHSFCTNFQNNECLDGSFPTSGLTLDAAGNLYGTTSLGGTCGTSSGCGTAFEIFPPQAPGGSWTEAVLYSFCSDEVNGTCLDGSQPTSNLTFDASGNLYGTTTTGGNGAWLGGTVFKLSPNSGGWTETVLYNFCANGTYKHCSDGTSPQAGVTFDNAGNLYGTTQYGGTLRGGGLGTVYKLSGGLSGWIESVLVAFSTGLAFPEGVVSFDQAGNLYSTANYGGSSLLGGVFRFSPKTGILRGLSFNGADGASPIAGALLDSNSKSTTVYGTTTAGGIGWGTVFKVASSGKETVVYALCQLQNCADGASPYASLIQRGGRLYGTTREGGAFGYGVVFEITP
jgi:uncharacterized repeat protein (TIGR03803 family)